MKTVKHSILTSMKPLYRMFGLLMGWLIILCWGCTGESDPLPEWPSVTSETKPWTRWWWPGSAVNKSDLTRELEAIHAVGIGGVEITPTYGARGYENHFIPYLSPQWLDMFSHTLSEAGRLGLGVDMANGTGWNFGGPTVTDEDAPQRVVYRKYTLREGDKLNEPVTCVQAPYVRFVLNQVYEVAGSYRLKGEKPAGEGNEPVLIRSVPLPDMSSIKKPVTANENLQALAIDNIIFNQPMPLEVIMAYSDRGEIIDLTDRLDDQGMLNWVTPAGTWKLYAVFRAQTGKMVERAAPGGEGFMINHMSGNAIRNYLDHMDTSFTGVSLDGLRAYFSDSYEVDDAKFWCDWTPDFFEEFRLRRGYDLTRYLPALFGEDTPDRNIRVLTDYRETVNDLIRDKFTAEWAAWAHTKKKMIRNQAHGSPANILDLYAASDIPETEGVDIVRIKFASSASHVTGKKLTSSESATFLNENFTSSLLDLKINLDRFFLGGVNHVFYHGTAFTPSGEDWPGWFFYVAIHLNPRNPVWNDSKVVHDYATNVQSFMQSGQPENDILLYYPVYDRYADLDTMARMRNEGDGPRLRMINRMSFDDRRWRASSFRELAEALQNRGYAADYISDLQMEGVDHRRSRLVTGDAFYQAMIIPSCTYMPLESFRKVLSLARAGATIIFQGDLPADVPGLLDFKERQEDMQRLKKTLKFQDVIDGTREARLGRGKVLLGSDTEQMLAYAGVRREEMTNRGLQFVRRIDRDGSFYFISNFSDRPFEGWVPLMCNGTAAAIFDPMSRTVGVAKSRRQQKGQMDVCLQLDPWQGIIIKTWRTKVSGQPYAYKKVAGDTIMLNGPWQLSFIEGGPVLPQPAEIPRPVSWTDLPGEEVKIFSGTALYSSRFARPGATAEGWWLNLGKVAESARVSLNGEDMGILIGPSCRLYISNDRLKDDNLLEVRVTNLAANRIADLDKRDVPWKKFYNNNIRPLRAANRGPDGMFTARHWEPRVSGLIGPVTLVPASIFIPE